MDGGSGTVRGADGWESVELPHRDGTLAAVTVLPPEGTDPCVLEAATLAALDDAAPEQVDIALPRLEVEQQRHLVAPLTALGLPAQGERPGLGEGLGATRSGRRRTCGWTRRGHRRPGWRWRCRGRCRSGWCPSTARSSSC